MSEEVEHWESSLLNALGYVGWCATHLQQAKDKDKEVSR